jgi:hypothetical protein
LAVQQAAIRNAGVVTDKESFKRDSISASLLKNVLALGELQGDPIYDNLKG